MKYCERCHLKRVGHDDVCPKCDRLVCFQCVQLGEHWKDGRHDMSPPRGRKWPVVVKCHGNGYLARDEASLSALVAHLERGDDAAALPFYSELYSRPRQRHARGSALGNGSVTQQAKGET